METRRSKRLHSKENVATQSTLKQSVVKKRSVSNSGVKNETKSTKKSQQTRLTPVKSGYFVSETRPETVVDQLETKTGRKTKSSYFESPIGSEQSDASDYEPNTVGSRQMSARKKSKSKSSYFESSTASESEESDYESDPPAKKSKQARNTKTKKEPSSKSYDNSSCDEFVSKKVPSVRKNSLIKIAQNDSVPKRKNTYESESDSSTDDFEKAPESLLDLNRIKSPSPAVAESHSDSGNEDTPAETTAEYFDFTAVLSQVSEVKTEEKNDAQIAKKSKQTNADTRPRRTKKTKNNEADNVKSEQMEVFELLAMGENTDLSAKDIKESVSQVSKDYEIPKQVEVLLDAPVPAKKKRCNDLEMALRRRLNNIKRENQIYIHKVHILCWIAHGSYLNSVLNSPDILSVALSLLPSEKCYPPKRMSLNYLEDLMNWFHKKVKLKKEPVDCKLEELTVILPFCFQKLEADNKTYFGFMFIGLLRALGIRCRLVINLNVAPIKPPSDQLLPINQKENETKPKSSKNSSTPKAADKSKDEKKSKSKPKKEESSSKKKEETTVKKKKETSPQKKEDSKNSEESNSKSGAKQQSAYFKNKSTDNRRSARLVNSSSKYFEGTSADEESSLKRRSKASSSRNKSKVKEKPDQSVAEMSSTDDSDFEETFVSPKKKKIDRRVLSSEEETRESKSEIAKPNKDKSNYWMEVFLEAEEKWFCIDIMKKNYHCIKQLYNAASHPVRYILAWNQDQSIKDVTRRYVPQYLTVTRKLRVDENWWKQTMKPYKSPNNAQNREEDEELDKMLEEQPLPASISEYKNHPLYALERHLLKFQGIYPSDAPPLGYIRGEPVYSRLCVHQLHGREMWIKEAKVVKMNEKPYKIVKGRPQRTKFGTTEPPKDLELFGSWQVEDYVPPAAENGKVPRNAFGNVELFKPSMLPKGTVYLQIPGLQRIASKLGIDCAAAIVGFEYSTNGWSYPVKDGFVVCEEYKDILLDAYNQEVEEAEKKEKQKREERVYANWRRLIRGLFIREKLKRKYNFGDPATSTSTEMKKSATKATK